MYIFIIFNLQYFFSERYARSILQALELHPDQGGGNDKFVESANAYNELLRTRT